MDILQVIRCASHCFPIEKAGRQDFIHIIAQTSINKDIKDRKNNVRHTVESALLNRLYKNSYTQRKKIPFI